MVGDVWEVYVSKMPESSFGGYSNVTDDWVNG